MEKANPSSDADAWDTEALSAEATAQLKTLAKLLSHPGLQDEAKLGGIIADGFRATASLPGGDPEPVEGAGAFFGALMSAHDGAEDIDVALKNYRFEPGSAAGAADAFTTSALFQSSSGQVQQNAEWACAWSGESPPRLRSITVSKFERVRSELRFVDATGSVLGAVDSARTQMAIGAGHWAGRLQKYYFIDSTGHQGIAIGDADGDGLDDLYVAQQGGIPNRLYVQNKDGTLRDVSAAAGVDWMELCHGVLFADLDNDGDQDLAIAQTRGIVLMENLGGLRFKPHFHNGAAAGYFSLAAADYDADGDLDLYACAYSGRSEGEFADGARVTVPLPYHDSRNGGPNLLLQNDGGWKFSDATVVAGLDHNNDRHSFACSWEDYDNDGDLDLYVANDFGRNNLYQNLGAGPDAQVHFKDVAADAGVEDMSAGMGVTWGDYDRDGLMDFYVSNMFSAAGNRVTYQRQFRQGADASTLGGFQRHARGNSLFRNRGDGTFADVSEAAGVTMGRWAWGAKFADLDNDGWVDLYVANGYITADPVDDL